MNSTIELLAPRYDIAWYPWAVQYFFMIALSYTSLWLAAPALILGKTRWLPTARLALLACITTTLVAPVALLADLHQPLRFWHFYAYANSYSWMSIGSLILPLYVVSVLALSWLAWRPALQANLDAAGLSGLVARLASFGSGPTPKWLVAVMGLAALVLSTGIMLYTGAEIAVVKARPLWNTLWLPPMLIATGFISAAGLILVLNRISGIQNADTNRFMLKTLLASGGVAAFIAIGWLLNGLLADSGSVAAALESVRYSSSWGNTALWGAISGVALFAAVVWALTRPAGEQASLMAWAWLIGLFALHMGWMFRWVVLMDVQTVARHSAGFHHYGIPAGSSGLLGIVGTFGLWLAVVLIIDLFVPWRQAQQGGPVTPSGFPSNTQSSANPAIQGAPRHG